MANLLIITSVLVAIAAGGIYHSIFMKAPPPIPDFDLNQWWGPDALKAKVDTSIRPFKIHFDEQMIKDLRERISHRRPFTAPLEGIGFQYGFNTRYLHTVLDYWHDKYQFTNRQNYLNQYNQYKTNIQGLDIHYIHVKPEVAKGTKVLPLLLLHGWPGSVREFYEMIPLLNKYAKQNGLTLELVIPSLPGYGFSDGAVRPGLGAAEVGVVMRNLMARLGHDKFYVQGGDWGSIIGGIMATVFPKQILGYHTNMPGLTTTASSVMSILGSFFPSLIADKDTQDRLIPLSEFIAFLLEETGYAHIQATKPDTIGVSLVDSPAGLAAYILEKFTTWTNPAFKSLPDGGLTKKFTLDQLIDNLMIYWSSKCIATSVRLYAESSSKRHFGLQLDDIPTPVPTAVIQAPHELAYMPVKILKLKYQNVVHSTLLDDGGHFLAFEMPDIVAKDIVKSLLIMDKLN